MSTLKRFRPSIESICSYAHCVESPSSIPCAHCSLTFCLHHLVEHQTAIDNEHKRLINTIENYRARLKTIEFRDNRYELFQQLNEWKTNMNENVEKVKNEIDVTYEQCDQEFHEIKETILNNIDNEEMNLKEVLANLEQSLHTLESSCVELIISKTNPTIRLMKPNLNSSSFSDLQNKIQPDLDRFLSTSEVIFSLDYDPNDTTLFATSSQYLIIYKLSRSIFELYDNNGQHLSDINYDHTHYGDLNQIIWSSYVNGFLLATSKQLLKLNCTTKRIGRYIDIGFGFFKDICAGGESILLVHNLGTSLGDVIEHYSNNQMIQRCWKSDLYPNELNMKDIMEIFRIRMSSHLVAIDALFTDKILVCDILHAMKCLFRIDTKHCSILSMSPIYDTKQWVLFVIDEQNESSQRRMLVINAQESDTQRRMREIKCSNLLPTNICFFGSKHFILTRTENDDEENMLFECRKMHNTF
ncbi:unnamed protein product [Adineta steineri]|uniref:Uncharacterized protein n=1 Tax=Adineta steineri TaxID=433720 RepID=A0A814UA53_9BILA|nr:unnamed protein product [Adineta steineri]CAF3829279.1 unnamed protein product [Adineta steineri]